ncbi:MAG: helix-turn-helix domain-containing protein [Planctomycetes bacterium]|nr:helix-turn-helix domain-containing protein [Planctomycetota bacterium]
MSKRPKLEAFQDQLRQAINASELSRYRICKLAGFSQSTMSRFMVRRGSMSLPSVDRLIEVLDLELRP